MQRDVNDCWCGALSLQSTTKCIPMCLFT